MSLSCPISCIELVHSNLYNGKLCDIVFQALYFQEQEVEE